IAVDVFLSAGDEEHLLEHIDAVVARHGVAAQRYRRPGGDELGNLPVRDAAVGAVQAGAGTVGDVRPVPGDQRDVLVRDTGAVGKQPAVGERVHGREVADGRVAGLLLDPAIVIVVNGRVELHDGVALACQAQHAPQEGRTGVGHRPDRAGDAHATVRLTIPG